MWRLFAVAIKGDAGADARNIDPRDEPDNPQPVQHGRAGDVALLQDRRTADDVKMREGNDPAAGFEGGDRRSVGRSG